jgi:hypothetical protein
MNSIPLFGNHSRGTFRQNGLNSGFPGGSASHTMNECIASEATRNAPVHVFAQAGVQLAAGAAAQVSLSSSSGVLLGTRLPDSLSGESDNQRLGSAGPTPYREVTSTPFADGGVLACAHPVVMICRPSQPYLASTGE